MIFATTDSTIRTMQAFPSAPYPPVLQDKTLPRVCIVSGECVGPFRNGGLGTAMTGLAELLAAYGFPVTMLYTGEVISADLESWVAKYNQIGIKFIALDRVDTPTIVGPLATRGWTAAYRLYAVLQKHKFDIVHFNDTMGEALYCMVAKRLGLAFQDTLLCLALHSPTQWILELNGTLASWIGFTCFNQGERDSIGSADLLWGPSRYLLDWVVDHGFKTAPQIYNQQYVVPTAQLFQQGVAKLDLPKRPDWEYTTPPEAIVFFGRLEERKGIRIFCNALAVIGDELKARGIRIVFLGKPSTINGRPSLEYLSAAAARWPFEWQMIDDFDQQQALDYLTTNRCVAVMPSPFDNSPCTVYEALQNGIPFLASRRGGIPELVHPDDARKILFEYKTNDLARLLQEVIKNGLAPARPAVSIDENRGRWIGMHLDWRRYRDAAPRNGHRPPALRIDAFIDHSGQSRDLVETLETLKRYLGSSLGQVAVVVRGMSPVPETLPISIDLLIEDNGDPNLAAVDAWLRGGTEGCVMLIRSGALLEPSGKDTILSASENTTWDALLATARINEPGSKAFMPSIGSPAFLFLEDSFDSGAVLVRKSSLAKSVTTRSLLPERPYCGVVDCLLLAKCVVWPLPVPIVSMSAEGMAVWRGEQAHRTMRYTEMLAHDCYFALGIGYWAYQVLFPPAISQAVIAQGRAGPMGRTIAGLKRARIRRVMRSIANVFGPRRARWLKNAAKRIARRLGVDFGG